MNSSKSPSTSSRVSRCHMTSVPAAFARGGLEYPAVNTRAAAAESSASQLQLLPMPSFVHRHADIAPALREITVRLSHWLNDAVLRPSPYVPRSVSSCSLLPHHRIALSSIASVI